MFSCYSLRVRRGEHHGEEDEHQKRDPSQSCVVDRNEQGSCEDARRHADLQKEKRIDAIEDQEFRHARKQRSDGYCDNSTRRESSRVRVVRAKGYEDPDPRDRLRCQRPAAEGKHYGGDQHHQKRTQTASNSRPLRAVDGGMDPARRIATRTHGRRASWSGMDGTA